MKYMYIDSYVTILQVPAGNGEGHTTTLVADDFAWQRGYSWYPDTPGQYPDSKWDYYYSSGGLYDQVHQSAAQVFLNRLQCLHTTPAHGLLIPSDGTLFIYGMLQVPAGAGKVQTYVTHSITA
jgi:hypothetical protein